MKHILYILLLASSLAANAIGIGEGERFYEGTSAFIATLRHGGIVYLSADDPAGDLSEITLEPVDAQKGVYRLIPSRNAEEPPFGLQWNARVEHITREGLNFLAFYIDDNTIVQTMVSLTHDAGNATDITEPDGDFFLTRLLNQVFLEVQTPDRLYSWIEQLDGMASKNLLQQVNAQMISYFITRGDTSEVPDDDFDGDSDVAPSENGRRVWYASCETDILSGIDENTIVSINGGKTYNLTAVLNNADFFTGIPHRDYVNTLEDYPAEQSCVVSEKVYDGRQAVIMGYSHFTIRGEGMVSIVADPRYANVISLVNCHDVVIENITLGHTDTGDCYGGVIYLSECSGVTIRNCDLFGCGVIGLEAHNCQNIRFENSTIRDCKDGILSLENCENTSFTGTDFVRCTGGFLLQIDEQSSGTVFDSCRFAQNNGLLFGVNSATKLINSEVHHDADDLYLDSQLMSVDKRTRSDDSAAPLPPRR